jgi:hypothetical protein
MSHPRISATAHPPLVATLLLGLVALLAGMLPSTAQAAKADGCAGGGYRLVNLTSNQVVASGTTTTTIPAAALGTDRFGVRGLYTEFDVRLVDFAVFNQLFTGAPNPLDMTGGVRTVVFASKVPDHRGLVLNSAVSAQLGDGNIALSRTGPGLSMTLTAKDCAAGGVFQMEVERGDGTRTRFTHTLANTTGPTQPFYFDNPNFRARINQFLGSDCTSIVTGPPGRFCVQVTARVNIANDFSAKFVVRDSAQVATRITQGDCNTANPITPSVRHCGGVSVWDVASGGRVGFVTGEDATEVANPPTNCTQQCQAQNQVRGRLAILGFPFPVPAGSRLTVID